MRFSAPLVAGLVALVLTVAFWFLLYKPASDQQAAVEAEIVTLEDQQRSLETQIEGLRDIEARQVEIQAALTRLEEFVPNGPAQPTAIRQFQRAADAAGTEIITVTFGEPSVPQAAGDTAPADTGDPETTLVNIPVTMTVDGGYFQIVDFFRRLEVDVPRAALIELIDLEESPEDRGGFPTLAATWTGQLFAIMPVADLPPTQSGVPAPGPSPTASPTPGGE